jgi:replicative DNA helicase
LGACLLGQAAEATRMLEPEDFSVTVHREIFAAICGLVERGDVPLEVSLLAAELRTRGVLDAVGGIAYLEDLDRGVVPQRSMQSRAKILRELAVRRRLLKAAEKLECAALDWTRPVPETLSWLREVAR